MEEKVPVSSRKKAASVLATLSLVFAILSIFLAVGLDIFAFKEAIIQFIIALILPIPAFIVFCLAMVVSCVFIFGIYLLKEYGFWPLDLSIKLFKQIIGDIQITAEQVTLFRAFRFVLLFICFNLLTMAIISKVLNHDKKEEIEYDEEGQPIKKKKDKTVDATSTVAIVFIVLGIIVSLAALMLSTKML